MKRMLFIILIVSVSLSGIAFAADDEVLAKIGNKSITKTDFERIIRIYPEAQQKMIRQNPERQKMILEKLVLSMVISKIAKEKGFDQRADVKEKLEFMTNDFLSRIYIQQEIIGSLDVTDKEAELYYQTHKDEFATPEMVRARHILINLKKGANEDEKKKARGDAEDILNRIKKGEDFAKVASEVSDDTVSKKKGGDLGFLRKGKMPPEFDKVAFSLKPREMSDIIETPQGYHIIKVEEKKKPEILPFEKVKDKVKARVLEALKKSKAEEFLDKAMKDAGVVIHTELLGK